MASALPSSAEELEEKLLICQICFDAFNSKTLKPLILPCHHSFCFQCLDDLGRHGGFPCPLCRTPIPFNVNVPASRQFKVDHTRMTLIDWAQTAMKSERTPQTPPVQSEEMCEKHGDEKIKYFCRRCRKPVCPSCVIKEHKEHDVAEVEVVCEMAKSQLLSACLEMDKRTGSVQQTARAARVGLQGLGSQEKATLGKMEEAFSRLVSYILESKKTAMEDFRAQVKQDRLRLEDFVASQESLLAAALSTVDFGRREASLGSASSVVVSLDQVMTFLADLSARQAETPIRQPDYQVRIGEFRGIAEAIGDYGRVETEGILEGTGDNSTNAERPSGLSIASPSPTCTQTHVPPMTAARRRAVSLPSGGAIEVSDSRPIFQCPKITLDPSRCSKDCSLDSDRTCLSNLHQHGSLSSSRHMLSTTKPPKPYRFLGTRGSEVLTGISYFEVEVSAKPSPEIKDSRRWTEVGVASHLAMKACDGRKWISLSSGHAAMTVGLRKDSSRVKSHACCCSVDLGDKDLADCPPRSPITVTLGCLCDVRKGRVFIIDVRQTRPLFQGHVGTKDPLYPVCRTELVKENGAEVNQKLLTASRVDMTSVKRDLIEGLLRG